MPFAPRIGSAAMIAAVLSIAGFAPRGGGALTQQR